MSYSPSLRVGLIIFLVVPVFTYAQATCGDIISINPFTGETEETVVSDCTNPFQFNRSVPSDIGLTIDGLLVADGATVLEIPTDSFSSVEYNFNFEKGNRFGYSFGVFSKQGADYVQIDFRPPTRDDISQTEGMVILEEFFAEDPDVSLYREAFISDDMSGLTFEQANLYQEFIYVELPQILTEEFGTRATVGMYWFVFTEQVICVSQVDDRQPWFATVMNQVIPRAHAQFNSSCSPEYVPEQFVIKLDIIQSPIEPTGASSVLFLPGIMGSRLYEESDVCDNRVDIQERWFSRDSCDQLRLQTTFLGKSENEIFTLNDQSSIVDSIAIFDLYKSFLDDLATQKETGIIKDYVALPYDWRLGLDAIVKSSVVNGRVVGGSVTDVKDGLLYQTVAGLAEDSLSGNVSIVTHSNGGLLAKYFLDVLAKTEDPLLDKIDNLFLVGVPQSGTPESVITLLHGTDIAGGFVLNQVTGRKIVNRMPVAHHLLPSKQYFKTDISVNNPVISFQSGDSTEGWISEYGTDITTLDGLHTFMSSASGRLKPEATDLLRPEVLDPFLLQYANVAHAIQSAWQPPESLQVHQLAGTGLLTPVGITYFTDQECIARSILFGFQCVEYGPKLGYRITMQNNGDGTVIFESAKSMHDSNQINNVIIDLSKHNKNNPDRVHRNLMEIEEIQNYIYDVLNNKIGLNYDYLSRTTVQSQLEPTLVFQLHSLLDMKIIAAGQELSSSTNEINGSIYERFGEVQYISIPRSVGEFELVLNGLDIGSFTLEIEEWQGDTMQKRTDFVAVPSITGTKVVLQVIDSTVPSTFTIDYDGDGEVDAIVTEDGLLEILQPDSGIDTESSAVTERTDRSSSSATRIDRSTPIGQVAGITTSTMTEVEQLEELSRLLTRLSELLTLLSKI